MVVSPRCVNNLAPHNNSERVLNHTTMTVRGFQKPQLTHMTLISLLIWGVGGRSEMPLLCSVIIDLSEVSL